MRKTYERWNAFRYVAKQSFVDQDQFNLKLRIYYEPSVKDVFQQMISNYGCQINVNKYINMVKYMSIMYKKYETYIIGWIIN